MTTKQPSWAVVDIGSNSVRLVVYDGPDAAPIPVLNEKSLCGLGKYDPDTGAIREEAFSEAIRVLARFRHILDAIRPKQTIVFATAGARDAKNGKKFVQAVADLGLSPVVLSGREEARLAALGVLSAAPEILRSDTSAVSGDLGGGSLELCELSADHRGGIGALKSVPLGGLRLASQYDSVAKAQPFIDAQLDKTPWLSEIGAKSLYVVGGAWRSIAKIALQRSAYPLDMLDHFELCADEVMELCDDIILSPVEDLAALKYIQTRRAPTLPFAAAVLKTVFERMNAERVVVSSCGVREGVIFDRLPRYEQKQDPLPVLTSYIAATSRAALVPNAKHVERFFVPLIEHLGTEHNRIWQAAISLSQVTLTHHPDQRGRQAALMTMGLPLRGVSHRERVLLATTLYYRHGGASSRLAECVPMALLSEDKRRLAKTMGLGLRFALELDPIGCVVLPRATLSLGKNELRLRLSKNDQALWGAGPAKRLARFADALNLSPVLLD